MKKRLTELREYIDHLENFKPEELSSNDYLTGYTLGHFRANTAIKNDLQNIYAKLCGYDYWEEVLIAEMDWDK